MENNAPFTLIGKYSSTPSPRSRISILPPVSYGGMVPKLPGSARATPTVPQNGFHGTRAHFPYAARTPNEWSELQMGRAKAGKSAARSPKSGKIPVQPQPEGSKPSNVTF